MNSAAVRKSFILESYLSMSGSQRDWSHWNEFPRKSM